MKTSQKGFTLVEMIVAIALFAVVMLVAVGALLSLTGAHRKAQALQTVMNNLNISLDGMVRNIRMGTEYNCVGGTSTGLNTANCPSSPGGKVFTFTCNPQTSACIASGNRWSYAFDDGSSSNRCVAVGKTAICKSTNGTNWTAITGPEVAIDSMTFYVVGTQPGFIDLAQPKVLIVLKGTAGASSAKTKTIFHIEAMAVQRELDLAQ